MPDLRATFELNDSYSSKVEKIIRSTDKAAASAEKASASVDKVNASLGKTGSAVPAMTKAGKATEKMADGLKKSETAAKKAEESLRKLIGTAGILATLKGIANTSDSFSNANARLNLVNDGTQSAGQFQQGVYASAQRSRASYDSTANSVASLMMNAGGAFNGNDEAIMFVEAINKQFVIAGASAAAAEGAMTQLTQAMGAGALRGEELNSILDAAPGIARNIEKYMGWAEGSIKSYAEKGMVSAEIVKNAQLSALNEINEKYNSMPYTWSQVWTKTMNTILWASQPVLKVVGAMANNWDIIAPILIGVGGAVAIYMVASKGAAVATAVWTAAQAAFNAVMALNPVALVAMSVVLLVSALYAGVAAVNHFTGTSISATGLIGSAFFTLGAYLYNTFIYPLWSGFAMLANFIGNACFNDATAAVKVLFLDMASTCIGYALNMARTIENIINKIPGVTVDFTSGLSNLQSSIQDRASSIKDASGWKEYVKQPKLLDYTEMASKGYSAGSGLADKISGFLSGGTGYGYDGIGSDIGTAGNPATIKGTGNGGSIKVDQKEDTGWLRQLAERDYVARIAQNTLAPNIKVEFSGPITKEADTDGVMAHVVEQLKDVIATAPEGVPT